uniref:DNA primase large subunit C-terminal domain-containing protein n=1 Tax=Quercus lobata TaxID=97700 RepID=A0A7N2L8B6_QUELO
MGQDVLSFLENRKENKSWYKGSRIAVTLFVDAVLKGIADSLSRGKKSEEMKNLADHLWKAKMRHTDASEVVNKDIISHFVLRLVEDLRKWFLSMETNLLRYRLLFERPETQRALMAEFNLPYRAASNAELEVVSLVATQFRSHLSKAPILTNRDFVSSMVLDNFYINAYIVQALCSSYLGPDRSQPREFAEISIKDIDQIAKNSFRLCMRHLFEKLREDHHLKHGGRMQLGLFLKGVGLKLEYALAFWKLSSPKGLVLKGLTRNMHTAVVIIKEDNDYTPYSCQTIITSAPAVGDHHGCPYRHFSEENVRATLGKMGITNRAVGDVMDKVRNRHYQVRTAAYKLLPVGFVLVLKSWVICTCLFIIFAVTLTYSDLRRIYLKMSAGIASRSGGLMKCLRPRLQPIDVQSAAFWGVASTTTALWIVQNTRMEKPNLDELYHVFTNRAVKFIDYGMMGDGSKSESWKEFKTSCLGNFAKNLVRKSLGQVLLYTLQKMEPEAAFWSPVFGKRGFSRSFEPRFPRTRLKGKAGAAFSKNAAQ